MDHQEAVAMTANEKYLLGELPPDVRDAFEEHFFDCAECALDLRASTAFLDHARVVLPQIESSMRPAARMRFADRLRSWLSPVVLAPVCAVLLAIVGFQNLVLYPALRRDASTPRVAASVTLHTATRGARDVITIDSDADAVLLVDLPQSAAGSLITFEVFNPDGKRISSRTVASPAATDSAANGTWSVLIPHAVVKPGDWKLVVSTTPAAEGGLDSSGPAHRQEFVFEMRENR